MADSLGKAIVTIVPELSKEGLLKAESALEKSGDAGGAKFVGGINNVLKSAGTVAVISGIAAAAAEVFAKSFEESARYEQLFGGMEKIFDQMDSSRILADAKGAWADLNMSANDYLEKINDVGASFQATMGDERGYVTARQGLKAIADYSSGTGKSMDELMGKFSAITRSAGSYQSIADQFSGILPATSAAFLEQAQAAGVLSDDYTKLTEVPIDEYQQAVAYMLEDGVRKLGLYDNTMNETEGTVSGSLAAMSAAFDNLLVAMGSDEGISEAAQNLVNAFGMVLSNIIPLAGQIIVGMGQALLIGLGNIASQAQAWIGQQIGNFFMAGADIVRGLANGIANSAGAIVEKIKEICSNALDAVKSFFGIHSPSRVMMEMGGYIGEGLALGISGSNGAVSDAMDGLMSAAYGRASMAGAGMAASFAGAGSYTANYTIGGINVTGDAEMEQAVLNVIGQLKRRGRI